jgi:triosephosphate isomerase
MRYSRAIDTATGANDMALTKEHRAQVYSVLHNEIEKARKALKKAEAAYERAPALYGGSVEREAAAMLVNMRREQYQAARLVASEYFDAYIAPAAA